MRKSEGSNGRPPASPAQSVITWARVGIGVTVSVVGGGWGTLKDQFESRRDRDEGEGKEARKCDKKQTFC